VSTFADHEHHEHGEPARFSVDDAWWGMAMITPEWVVVEANEPFARILGVTVGDLVGRRIVDVVGADELQTERSVARRLVEGESPIIEFRRRYDFAGADPWEGTVLASVLRDDAG
jgi:PAS domain S-box-containing protein